MLIISSMASLRDYVADHVDPFISLAEIRQIANAVNSVEAPHWGEDWTEYLAGIDLYAMLPEEV